MQCELLRQGFKVVWKKHCTLLLSVMVQCKLDQYKIKVIPGLSWPLNDWYIITPLTQFQPLNLSVYKAFTWVNNTKHLNPTKFVRVLRTLVDIPPCRETSYRCWHRLVQWGWNVSLALCSWVRLLIGPEWSTSEGHPDRPEDPPHLAMTTHSSLVCPDTYMHTVNAIHKT